MFIKQQSQLRKGLNQVQDHQQVQQERRRQQQQAPELQQVLMAKEQQLLMDSKHIDKHSLQLVREQQASLKQPSKRELEPSNSNSNSSKSYDLFVSDHRVKNYINNTNNDFISYISMIGNNYNQKINKISDEKFNRWKHEQEYVKKLISCKD